MHRGRQRPTPTDRALTRLLHAAALVAAGLLLASPASAATLFPSVIDASWLDLDGSLAVADHRGVATGDRLQLVAEAVRLETVATRAAVVNSTELSYGTREPRMAARDFGATAWDLSTWTNTSSLHLIGRGARLQADSGAARFNPEVGCLQQPAYFGSSYPSPCTPIDTSVLALGNSGEWRVTGDFTLALWGWDGSVQQAPSQEVWSGTRPTGQNFFGHGEVEMRQVHLLVTNGTLRLLPGVPAPLKAALASATFVVADAQATEELGELAGSQLTLSRDGEQMRAVTVPQPGPAVDASPAHEAGFAAAGAASLALATVPAVAFARRRAHLHRLQLAQRNLGIGNPEAAARHAWRVRHAAYVVEASVIGAVASIKASRLGMAQRFLDRLHACPRHDEATCKFLRAQLLVQQGDRDGGERLLEDCLALDGSFRTEAAANPVLAPHLDPSRWPGVPA